MQKTVEVKTYANIKLWIIRQIRDLFTWWHTYLKSKLGAIGLFVFLLMVIVTLLAPVLATHDPKQMTVDAWQLPSKQHYLGTSGVGQDIFSQLLFAGRMSLFVGIITALITNGIGTLLGLIAGYFGGLVDELLMRFADILLILPSLPLLIILAQFLGPGIPTIIFVISLTGWTGMARQIRALTLSLKQYAYVESTRALGASNMHIIIRHILPNVLGVVFSHYVMSVISIILMETGLSFLGFGDPMRPSWGQMLSFAEADGAFTRGAWWWWFPPGLCIALLCCSMGYISMTLNDRFVLRLRKGSRT